MTKSGESIDCLQNESDPLSGEELRNVLMFFLIMNLCCVIRRITIEELDTANKESRIQVV